jgi:hypothetical protein
MSRPKSVDERFRFGASFARPVAFEIDKVRGDTNRSLWLERLAIKELERLKKGSNSSSVRGLQQHAIG